MTGKLTTLDLSPVSSDYESAPTAPKRVLWKWSLAVTAGILVFLMWQCGSALHVGGGLSDKAVRHFHAQLNSGQYEGICEEADEGFSQGEKHDDMLRLLEVVHTKLGYAVFENQINMNVAATLGGTFITSVYKTQFAQDQAIETFIWKKRWGSLQLYGYNVQSRALLN